MPVGVVATIFADTGSDSIILMDASLDILRILGRRKHIRRTSMALYSKGLQNKDPINVFTQY